MDPCARGVFLVVEDDDLCARAIARALRPLGEPLVAASCSQARTAFCDDVTGVVVDCVLPDGCGIDLLESLLRRRPGLRALVCTGLEDPSFARGAFRLGAFYLRKPASYSELQQFALVSLASSRAPDAEVERTIDAWAARFNLTVRERELLSHAVDGAHHARLAALANVSPGTVKKQSSAVLSKTGLDSLERVVNAVLLETLRASWRGGWAH